MKNLRWVVVSFFLFASYVEAAPTHQFEFQKVEQNGPFIRLTNFGIRTPDGRLLPASLEPNYKHIGYSVNFCETFGYLGIALVTHHYLSVVMAPISAGTPIVRAMNVGQNPFDFVFTEALAAAGEYVHTEIECYDPKGQVVDHTQKIIPVADEAGVYELQNPYVVLADGTRADIVVSGFADYGAKAICLINGLQQSTGHVTTPSPFYGVPGDLYEAYQGAEQARIRPYEGQLVLPYFKKVFCR